MINKKKQIRSLFRDSCYKRDGYRCAMCSMKSSADYAQEELDAHHITDRSLMPNGGYVIENGISLCPDCHLKAEQFHSTGKSYPGYSPDELYKKINSSLGEAIKASQKLN